MKHPKMMIAVSGMAALFALAIAPAAEVKAEVALRAALERETVKGDLKGAIEQYKKIVKAYPDNRAVAAKALLHIAECYEKLGQSEAQKAYERVVSEYPDQKEAAEARSRLAARESGPHTKGVVVQQVWSGEDVSYDGRLSPDGRYLGFANFFSSENVAVRDLKAGETRLLTHDAGPQAWAFDAVFSPDGKQIAYGWYHDKDKDSSLRIIDSDGTHIREIARMQRGTDPAAWSPDGKQIAASFFYWVGYGGDNTRGIALISTADGSITRLKSTGRAPTVGGFSPDGRFLVYSLANSPSKTDGGIFAIAVDGSGETQLVQSTAVNDYPFWTPDGRAIVFLSDRTGTTDLWSIRVSDGHPQGEPELLRAKVGAITPIGFARDGLLYYSTNQLETDLYTAAFDAEKLTAASPVRITEQFIGSNYEAEPSPDGKLVAFLRSAPGFSGYAFGDRRAPLDATLVIRSAATGEERSLTKIATLYYQGLRSIRWYPDSRSVLLQDGGVGAVGPKRFRKIDVETGEARTLFEGPHAGSIWSQPELSRDGKTLFYSIYNASTPGAKLRLMRRDLDTGQETELYRRADSSSLGFASLTLSADGSRLAFLDTVSAGQQALVTVPVNGGAVTEIHRGSGSSPTTPTFWGASWTKDGRYLIAAGYLDGKNLTGASQLLAFPVEGGEPRVLGVTMPTISNPSVSPDGRHILFTSAQRKYELSAMRNFLPQLQTAR